MIGKNKILAVITARGGSKGVLYKNIRDLAGKPLIAWTIEEAKKSKYIDRLILSSDDQKIIDVAKNYDCEVPFVRPAELAQDDSSGNDVILHAIKQCPGFTHVIRLQPTSPLRTVGHIDSFIEQFQEPDLNCSISVTTPDKHPMWMFTMADNNRLCPFFKGDIPTNRQELPPAYAVNGALYMASIQWFRQNKTFLTSETKGFYMMPEESLDIDSEMDFAACEREIRA